MIKNKHATKTLSLAQAKIRTLHVSPTTIITQL